MSHHYEILLEAQQIPENHTLRIVCPICRGGKSAERSLSITRDAEGVVYQCFRAKCGVSGGTHAGTFSKRTEKPRPRPVWEGKTHPLPTKVAERIHAMWGVTDPPNWYWTTDYGGRVAMSVRSPKDLHRGWVLRAITSQARTKALTYINEGEEGLSWYKTNPNAPTVVVEDIPSAVRAAQYVNSVALLGTGIGSDRAREIAAYATRPIVMALDQDATSLSFKWAHKYKLLWGDVKVLPLTKDLKNMTEDELCQLLRRG